MNEEYVKSIIKYEGLTSLDAQKLLEKHGYNDLPKEKALNNFQILISQFKSPLVYVLLAAALITLLLREFSDSIIILIAIVLNTILGYIQENKAGKALDALKKLVKPTCTVIRDGYMKSLSVREIVPGDILVLNMGDKIPADGIVLDSTKLFVAEAILTGESEPINKLKDDLVFMGTIVTSGRGYIKVTITGEKTEMGKIAASLVSANESTPLHKQLSKFSNQLSIFVLGLTILVFLIGLLRQYSLDEIFVTSVALAVSSIPEGLLVALTAVLAIGMQRVLAKKGLVRNLVSAETLGGVTTICTDKTGTLTYGKMQVVEVLGDTNEIAKQVVLANDLDTSVVVAAWEWGKTKFKPDSSLSKLDSIPFTSETKLSASLFESKEGGNIVYVTGAPDVLLKYSSLTDSEKEKELNKINSFSKDGKRLLAFARKSLDSGSTKLSVEQLYSDLEWVGMLVFTDPIRKDIAHSLKLTHQAGIKLIVITGDFAPTAQAILKQLGIFLKKKNILNGEELESMSISELSTWLSRSSDVKLFARVKPNQKLKIVETLKNNGEVVAMTGDGVNDAPALAKADIGIVVGEASDVAKESADLVLLDSSFSTIVSAIEEGRTIFANIRKIILFLLSDSFEEIFLVLGAIILLPGTNVPLTAAQILWINLVSDGFPSLALTVEPGNKDNMNTKPRPAKEPLVNKWMLKTIFLASLTGGLCALYLYWYVLGKTGNLMLAQSVTFAAVGLDSLVYMFSVRVLNKPFWYQNVFSNKWLLLSLFLGFILLLIPFATSSTRGFFGLELIGGYWIGVVLASILMFIVIEISKFSFRHSFK